MQLNVKNRERRLFARREKIEKSLWFLSLIDSPVSGQIFDSPRGGGEKVAPGRAITLVYTNAEPSGGFTSSGAGVISRGKNDAENELTFCSSGPREIEEVCARNETERRDDDCCYLHDFEN